MPDQSNRAEVRDDERVRLRDEYIAFLNEANEGALGMAHVHGWRCSEANVHRGIMLRAAIEAADRAARD